MASFSIVIPVYNCDRFLENCLDSILRCGMDGNEILLIDDGSQDRSGEICDRYSSAYDCVHCFHSAHKGVAAARNFGMEKATRDYLLFVDGDDAWSDAFQLTELQAEIVGAGEGLSVFGYSMKKENGDNRMSTKIQMPQRVFGDWRKEQGAFLEYFPDGWMFPCWNKVFNRVVILRHGLSFHQQQMEDFRFVLDYLDVVRRVSFLKTRPYIYHKRASGTSLTDDIHDQMLDGYNDCHRLFLSLFDDSYSQAIHRIMAPQYIATANKCMRKTDSAVSRSVLCDLSSNSLANTALAAYKPSSFGESITLGFMRKGWFCLLDFYRKGVAIFHKR